VPFACVEAWDKTRGGVRAERRRRKAKGEEADEKEAYNLMAQIVQRGTEGIGR
jgi:hypothetical protein